MSLKHDISALSDENKDWLYRKGATIEKRKHTFVVTVPFEGFELFYEANTIDNCIKSLIRKGV